MSSEPFSAPSATEEIISKIAQLKVAIDDLSPDQAATVEAHVMFNEYAADEGLKERLKQTPFLPEFSQFIRSFQASPQTQETYLAEIMRRLVKWCHLRRIPPLALSRAQADDFVLWLRTGEQDEYGRGKKELSSATVRKVVGAASSFYSWLEYRHDWILNPFRGTRARPERSPAKTAHVPSRREVDIMSSELPGLEAAAAEVLAHCGLRVGALTGLTVSGNQFATMSRGKPIEGTLSEQILAKIETAGLPKSKPFAEKDERAWRMRLYWLFGQLHKKGLVQHHYSAHDLRHFFVVEHYSVHRDLYALSALLGTTVSTTEQHLRVLGVQPS